MTDPDELKRHLGSVAPDSGANLSSKEVDELIDVFREIADANLELIVESARTRKELSVARKTIRRMMIEVGTAVLLMLVVVFAAYQHSESIAATSRASAERAKRTDDNVVETLGVVRAMSEALSAKVKAEVKALGAGATDEEIEAVKSAEEAQRKALEVEVKVAGDPKQKAAASRKLEKLDDEKKYEPFDKKDRDAWDDKFDRYPKK